jgi:cell wall-associated NlpC family hydrolase
MSKNKASKKNQSASKANFEAFIQTNPLEDLGDWSIEKTAAPNLTPQQIAEEAIIQQGQRLHLTPEQIIGGLAVAKNESGYNPYATGDNGTSFGLFQLHEQGALPSSWTPQMAYNPNQNAYYSLQQAFKGAPKNMTAAEAQDWMTTHFERPANVSGDENPVNLAAANQIYRQLSGKPELTAAQLGALGAPPSGGDVTPSSSGILSVPQSVQQTIGPVGPTTKIQLGESIGGQMAAMPNPSNFMQPINNNSMGLIDPTLMQQTGYTPQGVGDISTTSKVSKKIIENMIEANYSDEDIAKIIKQASQDKVAIRFGGIINGIKNMINSNPLHPAKQMATNAAMSVVGSPASKADQQQNAAVADALSQVGVPYQWGGTTPGKGLDCSGLAQYAWGKAGVSIPRTTYQQLADPNLQAISTNPSAWHPGDLIYLDNGDHVGMYIGDGKVVQAPHTGTNVQVSSLDQGWNKPFAVRRPDVSGTLTSNAEANAVAVGAGGGPGVSNNTPGIGNINQTPSPVQTGVSPTSAPLQLAESFPINTPTPMLMPPMPMPTSMPTDNSMLLPQITAPTVDGKEWIPGEGFVSTSSVKQIENMIDAGYSNKQIAHAIVKQAALAYGPPVPNQTGLIGPYSTQPTNPYSTQPTNTQNSNWIENTWWNAIQKNPIVKNVSEYTSQPLAHEVDEMQGGLLSAAAGAYKIGPQAFGLLGDAAKQGLMGLSETISPELGLMMPNMKNMLPGQQQTKQQITAKENKNFEDIAEKEFDNEIEEFTESLPEDPKKYNQIDESGRPGTNRKASFDEFLMKIAEDLGGFSENLDPNGDGVYGIHAIDDSKLAIGGSGGQAGRNELGQYVKMPAKELTPLTLWREMHPPKPDVQHWPLLQIGPGTDENLPVPYEEQLHELVPYEEQLHELVPYEEQLHELEQNIQHSKARIIEPSTELAQLKTIDNNVSPATKTFNDDEGTTKINTETIKPSIGFGNSDSSNDDSIGSGNNTQKKPGNDENQDNKNKKNRGTFLEGYNWGKEKVQQNPFLNTLNKILDTSGQWANPGTLPQLNLSRGQAGKQEVEKFKNYMQRAENGDSRARNNILEMLKANPELNGQLESNPELLKAIKDARTASVTSIHEQLKKEFEEPKFKIVESDYKKPDSDKSLKYLDKVREEDRKLVRENYEGNKENQIISPEEKNIGIIEEYEKLMNYGNYDEASIVLSELGNIDLALQVVNAYEERVS